MSYFKDTSKISTFKIHELIPREVYCSNKDLILFLPLIFGIYITNNSSILKDIEANHTYIGSNSKGDYYIKNIIFNMIEDFHKKLPSFMRRISKVIITNDSISPFISTNPYMCNNCECSFNIENGECGRIIHKFDKEYLVKTYFSCSPIKKEFIIHNMKTSIKSKINKILTLNSIDIIDMKDCYEIKSLIDDIQNNDLLDKFYEKGFINKTDDERYFID